MTQIQHNDVIRQLQELGLSEHEASIYIAILKNGEASAGVILDEVKLHREQVYRALKRLVDDGLLTHYIKRKRSYYSAVSPDVLVKRMQAKTEIAESLQPYLSAMHLKRPQTIKVNEGLDSFRIMFEDILSTLDEGEEYFVLGGAGEAFYEHTKDFYPKYAKKLAKKRIALRMVAFEGEDFRRQFATQELLQVRMLPTSYKVAAPTAIYGDKVAIEIFDYDNPDNLAVITIENKKVAEHYRQTFETIWNLGTPIDR